MNDLHCPFCNSTSVEVSLKGFSAKSLLGNNYVQSCDGVNFYYCNNCFCGWRDGDLSLLNLYSTSHSQHNKGFTRFIQLLQGFAPESFYNGVSDILNLSSSIKESPLDIIEFGCPMNSVSFS